MPRPTWPLYTPLQSTPQVASLPAGAAPIDAVEHAPSPDPTAAYWHDRLAALRVQGLATPRLVGHVFSIGGSNQLEGSYFKHTSQEMWLALRRLEGIVGSAPTRQRVSAVMSQLARLHGWADRLLQTLALFPMPHGPQGKPPVGLAEEMAATIATDPRVLLPVSARGSDSSHATLVEVVMQADRRYTVRIFNSSYQDRRQYAVPGTRKQASHTDVHDIPAAIMQSPWYIQRLLQLGYASHKPFSQVISGLYDWALDYGVLAPPPQDLHADQSVGNCAWKCLASYVRDRLPKVLYLRLKLGHQAQVLQDYAQVARVPVLLTQMAPLYGAACAWNALCGVPALHAAWSPLPVAYAPVPIGWTWNYDEREATLMRQSQRKLDKTYSRYMSEVLLGLQASTDAASRGEQPPWPPPRGHAHKITVRETP